LREHRAGCRLPPAQRLSRPLANPSPDAVRSRNPSKSTPAHDAVAAAVLHKHHSIIRVGAGLIKFVYGLHLRSATGVTSSRILFWPFLRPSFISSSKNHRILNILEFKWSSDRNEDFLGVKEDEANEQHKSVIDSEALKAAAPEWTFEQINVVAGRRGAVAEDNFFNKLERLNVQTGKKDTILAAHVQRICAAHDAVMRSYYQQIHGSSKDGATMSMKNIGEHVCL